MDVAKNFKAYYTYDTREYRLFSTMLLGVAIAATIGIVIFAIICFTHRKEFLFALLCIGICLFILILAIPARKKHLSRIKNETIVAHDWGLEHQVGGESREVKWHQISSVEMINRSFLLYSMKEYVVSVSGDAPILFYSSLENSDFLVNYIRKNLKKREEIHLGLQTPKETETRAKFEDVTDD